MDANPRIRRITLVPYEGPDDELRRYRLARMDEIALATPPDPSAAKPPSDHRASGSAANANSGNNEDATGSLG